MEYREFVPIVVEEWRGLSSSGLLDIVTKTRMIRLILDHCARFNVKYRDRIWTYLSVADASRERVTDIRESVVTEPLGQTDTESRPARVLDWLFNRANQLVRFYETH